MNLLRYRWRIIRILIGCILVVQYLLALSVLTIVDFLKRLIYFTYVNGYFCLHVHLRTTCVPGIHKGQKKTLDLLEEDLQMAVSCYVAAGN